MLKLFLGSALLAVASACYCLTTSGVNVRNAACGTVIGSASSGQCYKYNDKSERCTLDGTSYNFLDLNYGSSGSGWIADNYLRYDATACSSGGNCGGVRIISREEWGARPPTSQTPLPVPKSMTFAHHSAGAHCYTQAECSQQVRNIQSWHMDGNGWSDIGYNFLVGEDGNAYEGRGWDVQGAHATNYNSQSHGTCMIGTFSTRNPNQAALTALENLWDCGVSLNKITSGFKLHGHRDGGCTECPGNYFHPNWVATHWRYGGVLSGCAKKDWGPSILYD